MQWETKKGHCDKCGHVDDVYGFHLRQRIGEGTDPQGEPYVEDNFDKLFLNVLDEINGFRSADDIKKFIGSKHNITMYNKKVERELSRLLGYGKIAADRDEHKLFYASKKFQRAPINPTDMLQVEED